MRRQSQLAQPQGSLLPRGIKHYRQPSGKIIFNVANTRYPLIEQICRELNYQISYQKVSFQQDVMWRDTTISVDFLANMQPYQKINHFPGMSNLSRKAQLARNIRRMQNAFPDSYAFFPLTFIIPQDILALRKFQERGRFKGQMPTFIIKPQIGCQGKGIYLWQNSIELQTQSEVIQLYIQRPLLYKGLKFDFRVYILVTGCSPLRLYIFNEGLVRLATQTYQRPNQYNIEDMQMHLTNYSINRTNPKYIYNDSIQDLSKGHKKSMAQFFQMLQSLGLPAHQYWSTIKDIAVKTLIAGLPWLKKEYETAQPLNKSNTMCFEILGLDFLIQDNHKVHLLQINHAPSFNTDTPLDYLVKSTLIKEALQLVKKQHELRNKLFEKSNKNTRARQKQIIIQTSDVTFSQKKVIRSDESQQYNCQLQVNEMGCFQRIYPNQNEQKQYKYDRLLTYSLSSISIEVPKNKRKQNSFTNSKKRAISQPKNHQSQRTNQHYYPSKQKLALSRLRNENIRASGARIQRAFDRRTFKRQINSRQQNQLEQRKRRGSYHINEQFRGETISNAAQLSDILQNHQIRLVTPQARQKIIFSPKQSYT